eukprot:7126895-Pyramimonas_sp.AAC.1
MARRPRSGLARVRPGSDSTQDRFGVVAISSNLFVSTSANCSGGVKKDYAPAPCGNHGSSHR